MTDSRIKVQPRALPEDVLRARSDQREADRRNGVIVRPRINAHLAVVKTVLNDLRDTHQRVVDVTGFDPLDKTHQSAAWLLAGRSLSLGYALLAAVRAGLTADIGPTARTLQEATGAVRIMLDPVEEPLHKKWLRDGYFKPDDLRKAQSRAEDRQAVEILKLGHAPPSRTHDLEKTLYDHWSKIAHNRRSGIIESYSADLREFSYGSRVDPLLAAVWAGYATQVQVDVVLTVGAVLTKIFGPGCWAGLVEPAIGAIDSVQRSHPLDPETLGFPVAETGIGQADAS